ncbi:hypothetical protein IF2G_02070 [Cordyceps javanica]|nr:hypothetical protein IF2G_02070 [Cordyceps javanica]
MWVVASPERKGGRTTKGKAAIASLQRMDKGTRGEEWREVGNCMIPFPRLQSSLTLDAGHFLFPFFLIHGFGPFATTCQLLTTTTKYYTTTTTTTTTTFAPLLPPTRHRHQTCRRVANAPGTGSS